MHPNIYQNTKQTIKEKHLALELGADRTTQRTRRVWRISHSGRSGVVDVIVGLVGQLAEPSRSLVHGERLPVRQSQPQHPADGAELPSESSGRRRATLSIQRTAQSYPQHPAESQSWPQNPADGAELPSESSGRRRATLRIQRTAQDHNLGRGKAVSVPQRHGYGFLVFRSGTSRLVLIRVSGVLSFMHPYEKWHFV